MKSFTIFFCLSLVCKICDAQNTYTISSGTNLVTSGSINLVFGSGNLTDNGTFNDGSGTVTFTGAVTYAGSGTTSLNNLIVNHSSATSVFNNPVSLTGILTPTAGTLNANGNLILKSSSSATASVASGSGSYISGNVIVERYVPSHAIRRYTLVSSPVNSPAIYAGWQENGGNTTGYGTQITGASSGNGFDAASAVGIASIYGYDDNQSSGSEWVGLTNTNINTLSAGTGYLLFVRGDRTVAPGGSGTSGITTLRASGTLTTGTVTFATSGGTTGTAILTSGASKYNLIANPYPCVIDWTSAGVVKNNVSGTFTVYDPNLGSFVTSDGTTVSPNTGQQQAKYIQSGQAFFIQNAAIGTPSLVISESAKNTTASTSSSNTVFGLPIPTSQLNINFYNSGNEFVDGAVAVFNSQYKKGVDSKDADKFTNFGETISFATPDQNLSIAARPLPEGSDTLWINMQQMFANAVYNVSIDGSGWNNSNITSATLIDNTTHNTTDLDLTTVTKYNFTTNSTKESNRLMIVLNNKITQAIVPVNSSENLTVNILGNPVKDQLIVNYSAKQSGNTTIRLINSNGQILNNINLGNQQQGQVTIPVKQYLSSIYLLEINVGDFKIIKKVVKD